MVSKLESMPGASAVRFPFDFAVDTAKAKHLIGDPSRYHNVCRLHVGSQYLTDSPALLADQSVSDTTAELVVCGVLGLGMRSSYGDRFAIHQRSLAVWAGGQRMVPPIPEDPKRVHKGLDAYGGLFCDGEGDCTMGHTIRSGDIGEHQRGYRTDAHSLAADGSAERNHHETRVAETAKALERNLRLACTDWTENKKRGRPSSCSPPKKEESW